VSICVCIGLDADRDADSISCSDASKHQLCSFEILNINSDIADIFVLSRFFPLEQIMSWFHARFAAVLTGQGTDAACETITKLRIKW
jgi:hypothetical protein